MIDKDCFPIHKGTCTSYGGALFPETVKYSTDDSIDDAIERLTKYVLSKDTPSQSKGVVDIDVVPVYSSCSSKIKYRSVKYEVEPTNNGANFSFDLSDIVDKLPPDFNVSKSKVSIISNQSFQKDFSDIVGGVALTAKDYPLYAEFEVLVITPCGLVKMSKEVKISIDKESVTLPMLIKDFGGHDTSEALSYEKAIEVLTDSVNGLNSKIEANLDIGSEDSVSSSLISMKSTQSSFETSLKNIESDLSDSVKNTDNAIDRVLDEITSLSSQLKTVNSKLKQLEKDFYSNS